MAEREPLTVRDLAELAAIVADRAEAPALFAAADALVRRTIGHKLFTVMRVHEAVQEVERLYSSDPRAYPVGGRKKKADTPWGRVVLTEGRVFVARTPDGGPARLRRPRADLQPGHRLDHERAHRRRGPAARDHERLARRRLVHPEDAEKGRVIAAVLAPPFLRLRIIHDGTGRVAPGPAPGAEHPGV